MVSALYLFAKFVLSFGDYNVAVSGISFQRDTTPEIKLILISEAIKRQILIAAYADCDVHSSRKIEQKKILLTWCSKMKMIKLRKAAPHGVSMEKILLFNLQLKLERNYCFDHSLESDLLFYKGSQYGMHIKWSCVYPGLILEQGLIFKDKKVGDWYIWDHTSGYKVENYPPLSTNDTLPSLRYFFRY